MRACSNSDLAKAFRHSTQLTVAKSLSDESSRPAEGPASSYHHSSSFSLHLLPTISMATARGYHKIPSALCIISLCLSPFPFFCVCVSSQFSGYLDSFRWFFVSLSLSHSFFHSLWALFVLLFYFSVRNDGSKQSMSASKNLLKCLVYLMHATSNINSSPQASPIDARVAVSIVGQVPLSAFKKLSF